MPSWIRQANRSDKGPFRDSLGRCLGVGGDVDGMPRSFSGCDGGSMVRDGMVAGGIPHVDGQPSMIRLRRDAPRQKGKHLGRRARSHRAVNPLSIVSERAGQEGGSAAVRFLPPPVGERPAKLPCHVVFAPQGTTTDGSGYTAIEMGKDGRVYVGAARYGDYAWLLHSIRPRNRCSWTRS